MRCSMNEWKLEEELKEKAEKISMEEFSSRFKKLQQREKEQNSLERETVYETVSVLETEGGAQTGRHKLNKSLIISISFALLCLLILAIVLPLTLNKKPPMCYGTGKVTLNSQLSDKEEFYRELQIADIDVPDLSECDVEIYTLFFSAEDDSVKGGSVDYYDERNNSSVLFEIYTADVEVKIGTHDFDNKCNTVTIQDTTVQYLIVDSDDEGAYSMLALAYNAKYKYRFELLSDNENVLSVFESLFA